MSNILFIKRKLFTHNLTKFITAFLGLFIALFFISNRANAQSVYYLSAETFPNYTTMNSWPGTNTFTGSIGTFTATVNQTYADIDVFSNTYRWTAPNAVRMQNNAGASASSASFTSPVIDLSAYSCSSKGNVIFSIYTGKLPNSSAITYKLEVSNDGGATWNTTWQQTAAQILSSASDPAGWNDIHTLVPSGFLVSNFRYRFTGSQAAGAGLNSEVWIDDILIDATACRKTWINSCADNKDVDLYTKSMTNSCVNGSLGWTNIGTTDGLNMTNASEVKLYVSTSEHDNPTRTVTVRSKNSSGTVLETQTLSLPTNNQEHPSYLNLYEFTFTSLAGVTNFEATVSGGCSQNNLIESFIANGMGLAVFRNSVTGNYNTGELAYWGAPGYGLWNYYRIATLPATAYTKTALVELSISGLYNNGKGARILLEGANGTQSYDVYNTDPTTNRIKKVYLSYNNIAGSSTSLIVKTDQTFVQNGVYSIDAVKVSVTCSQPLNLGNIVFNDANNNGVKDGAEVGVAGVTVNLYEDANADNIPDGKILQSVKTDASGNYNFTGLLAGNYIVGVVIPDGYTAAITTGTSSNPNNDTDNDNNGVSLSNDGTEIRSCYITLSAAGEPTTDGDGNYGNLTMDFGLKANACVKTTETFPNTYNTGFTAPVSGSFVGSSGTWSVWSKNAKGTVAVKDVDFGVRTTYALKLACSATNGNNIDTYADGTSPVINASGNCCPNQTKLNFTLFPKTVNINDTYSYFEVQMSGDGGTTWTSAYKITGEEMNITYGEYTQTNLSVPIPTSLQTNNFKYRFALYSSYNSYYDFFIYIDDISISSPATCGTGSIGNFVWNDANMNGIQDVGETGISGVTVSLLDNNGSLITTTTTNASGNYTFSNLPAGTYQVSFATPSGYNQTWIDRGTDDTKDSDPYGTTVKNIVLTTGQNRTDIDAGFFPICSTLFNETFPNTYNSSYTTPTNGTFTGNLGTYTVASNNGYAGLVVESNGSSNYVKSINYYDGSGTLSSMSMTSPTLDLVQGAGCTQWVYLNFEIYPLYINVPPGSDAYKVYIDFSGDNGATWSTGWSMNGADIVNYYGLGKTSNITVNLTSAVYTTTFKYRLRTEQKFGSYCDNYILFDNFQIRKCPCPPLNLGNVVWIDVNNNGVKDSGEPGVNGATVNLYEDNNGDNIPDGAAIATTTTNASGVYSFTTLVPATYIVGVVLPSGYVATTTTASSSNPNNDTDNDNNGVTTVSGELRSNYITLSTGGEPASGVDGDGTNGNLTLDFGLRAQLNLGNAVWVDVNNNGIKDSGEPGVSGATVYLYQDANADNTPDGAAIATTTTDASGNYSFTGLPAGNYIVGVVLPSGYTAAATTGTSSNPNNDTDNDNNGVTTVSGELRSNYVTLSVGGEPASGTDGDGTNGNLTLDFGIKGALNLGNLVWNDTNGNGVKDASESGINGVTVYLYQDANGDNTPDGAAIATTTTAGGGIYGFSNLPPGNYIVGYVLPTGFANTFKPTNNANPNSDTDGDNNGVTLVGSEIRSNYITLSAAGEPASGVDGDGTNGNLTLDFGCAKDTDGDKIPDVIDIDDDNDGITDVKESGGYDPLADCDADGTPNYLDATPGCATPSGNDAWGKPFVPLTWTDCNSDGINDFFDWDRDGIINELDLDSDNDGILDVQEARPGSVAVGSTSNGMITGTDADNDGLLSSQDINAASPYNDGIAAQDLDRDGTPNFLDLDSDGDGINDATEALNSYDADGVANGSDTDGDGVKAESFGSSAASTADGLNGFGAKGFGLTDSDGDGYPNAYDIDSDNDGITDNVEAQATCTYKPPTNVDCDGDGIDDAYDASSLCVTCTRTSTGITPYDKDGDATPDYLDTDTDNDGALDIYEGHSISSTIPPVNYWTGSLGDADKDGLYDYFDNFNILTETSNYYSNVTSNNMGTNGSFATSVTKPGSIVQLPENDGLGGCAGGGERDWRTITILPVTLTSFTGNLNSNIVKLAWTVTSEANMSKYIVERSIDGINFNSIAQVAAKNPTSITAIVNYTASDDVSNINVTVIYYRIKMIENNGATKNSSVLSFKLNAKKQTITVNPNPATSYFNIKINALKETNASIKVMDFAGRTVIMQNTKILVGANTVLFNNISNLAAGTYSVQVIMDGELFTEKLIITK